MSCEQLPATRRRGQRRTRARQRAREQAQTQLELAQANGRAAKSKAAEEKFRDLIEDLEWLLDAGESPHTVLTILGYRKPDSLAKRFYRHGRNDLAVIYWREAKAERVVA